MFRLYSEEKNIFTFDDYGALIDECRLIGARTVLEFGPGISTLAFIEAGCQRIATCEYQDKWIEKAKTDFTSCPQVSVHRFKNAVDVEVSGLSRRDFDLVFVDSPIGSESRSFVPLEGQEDCPRFNTLVYALRCAPVVLLHDAKREGEQRTLTRIAEMGYSVEMIETVKGIARIVRKAADAVPIS